MLTKKIPKAKLSDQVRILVVVCKRWKPQKQAQILRLAKELEALGL